MIKRIPLGIGIVILGFLPIIFHWVITGNQIATDITVGAMLIGKDHFKGAAEPV